MLQQEAETHIYNSKTTAEETFQSPHWSSVPHSNPSYIQQIVKKMKLPFLFMKSRETTSSWLWPTCGSPKTISFRAGNNVLKTMNSAFVETRSVELIDTPDSSSVSNSFESASFSTASEAFGAEESIETVIRGLRSERLFFEPGETSSILEEVKNDGFPFKESVVMAVDSRDPFVDFRRSMQEMVEAHGLKDWECLEELLTCYLRVNSKSNHGYIVGAFVDLLVGLAFSSSSSSDDHCSSSTTHSFTSPLSFSSSTFSTSPCLSILEVDDEIEKSIDNASSTVHAQKPIVFEADWNRQMPIPDIVTVSRNHVSLLYSITYKAAVKNMSKWRDDYSNISSGKMSEWRKTLLQRYL